MSDNLPDVYTGAPNAPETVMVLPRAHKPAAEPSKDEPITVLVAARTVGDTFDLPRPTIEDRTAPPEPDAPQPDRDTPRRIRRPRMWDLGREKQPAADEPAAVAQGPQQPEPEDDAPQPEPPQQHDDAPRDEQPEPAQHVPASPRYAPNWGQMRTSGRYYYDLHFGQESGWNWTRIRFAWRWIAPAGLGWGINLLHSETSLLTRFHDPAVSFWTGAVLVGAGGWIVWKTRHRRPIVAWLTRVPLSTFTAAWLALPVTMPALSTLTAAAIHTAAAVVNTLTHR